MKAAAVRKERRRGAGEARETGGMREQKQSYCGSATEEEAELKSVSGYSTAIMQQQGNENSATISRNTAGTDAAAGIESVLREPQQRCS
jgi:hypothetical protein